MVKLSLVIERLQAGQPRAYADSYYEGIISLRNDGTLTHDGVFYQELNEDLVKRIAKLFLHPFPDKPECWADPILKVCEAIGPTEEMVSTAHEKWKPKKHSRWRVVIVDPYKD